MEEATTKACCTCKEIKAIAEFQSRTGKEYPKCNECRAKYYKENTDRVKARAKQYHEDNKERINIRNREYAERNKESILASKRRYYQENKDNICAYQKEYRKNNYDKVISRWHKYYNENKEQLNAKNKQYYYDHQEERQAKSREWYHENKEAHYQASLKYNMEHRDAINAWSREWNKLRRAENPGPYRARWQAYRARKAGAAGTYTADDVDDIYIDQLGKCTYCGSSLSDYYEVDHIIPLARQELDPTNYPSNLQLLCPTCNKSKGPKTHEEYIVYLFKLGRLDPIKFQEEYQQLSLFYEQAA